MGPYGGEIFNNISSERAYQVRSPKFMYTQLLLARVSTKVVKIMVTFEI